MDGNTEQKGGFILELFLMLYELSSEVCYVFSLGYDHPGPSKINILLMTPIPKGIENNHLPLNADVATTIKYQALPNNPHRAIFRNPKHTQPGFDGYNHQLRMRCEVPLARSLVRLL